jgi:beta-lactamase class A
MFAHSDNTASDIALAACRVEKVRALIAQAGLANAQIPASTRLHSPILPVPLPASISAGRG